jgi:murein DD-endopeptidase MepM/ murein hydrolase activator NlpD
VSPEKQAGLVLALSTLVVVTAVAVIDMFRAPPTTSVVAAVAQKSALKPVAASKTVPVKAAPPTEPTSFIADRKLLFPVKGFNLTNLRDNFDEERGKRRHEALDIMAARGTPVIAVDDGRVAKLFRSAAGGITVYQFDRDERYVYYYAHLDGYAQGLAEGTMLKRGDLVGFVGSTGNAPAHAPHLHFTIFELGPEKKWWKGRAINPYPLLKSE